VTGYKTGVNMVDIKALMDENLLLLNRLIQLRTIKDVLSCKENDLKYEQCFKEALNKFSYIVDVNTSRYKKFSNYKDLLQEGKIGLIISLAKFDPNRSKNFFKLANWYIKTRIKRAANKHDVISAPIVCETKVVMNRLNIMPIMLEHNCDAEDALEKEEVLESLKFAIGCLSDLHKNVICLYYGIGDGEIQKTSLSVIAKVLKKPKQEIELILQEAHELLSNNQEMIKLMEE
jgi:RNA polymerase sigma factor (sigma-70 family)